MKNKRTTAAHIWKQLEDVTVPQLQLSPIDRAIYSHLLRHSHLEGTSRISFSVPWLAHGTRMCAGSARISLRRLLALGALRLIFRSKLGHVIDVRLPHQILTRRAGPSPAVHAALPISTDIEHADFMNNKQLRFLIHEREGGLCFYCLRSLDPVVRCVDHVIPQMKRGTNSYRNLVSSCVECNSGKRQRTAAQFLRQLYRERRLSSAELAERLRALSALAAGRLRPAIPGDAPLQSRDRTARRVTALKGKQTVRQLGPVKHWAGKGRRVRKSEW